MSLFSRKQKKAVVSYGIYTINDSSVTGAIVHVYTNSEAVKTPVIIFSYQQAVAPFHFSENSIESAVYKALQTVLQKCQSAVGNVDHLVCSISEPWVLTSSRIMRLHRKESFIVTQKMIDEMMIRDIKLYEQEIFASNYHNTALGIIETSKPQVFINGYITSHYQKIRTTNLELRFLTSVAQVEFAEEIIAIFGEVFHRHDIHLLSQPIARLQNKTKDFSGTYLVIRDYTSTISIIDRGFVMHNLSFSKGIANIRESLQELFSIKKSAITGLLRLARDTHMLHTQDDVFHTRINKAADSLISSLERAFHILANYENIKYNPIVIDVPLEYQDVLRNQLFFSHMKIIWVNDLRDCHDITLTHQAQAVSDELVTAILHHINN